MSLLVGTAAWNIPKDHRAEFPAAGSILESYSLKLPAVEINSSFYRHHQAKTYVRWAQSVPENFRFSVKLHREFTHEAGLELDDEKILKMKQVIQDYQGLGSKLGCLLIQLPPSLVWDQKIVGEFFFILRKVYSGPIALEPRHFSWQTVPAQEALKPFRVSKVYADPAPIPNPSVDDLKGFDVAYFRLHGSPEIYKSNYDSSRLEFYAQQIRAVSLKAKQVWCIFDNTTFGFATANALKMFQELNSSTFSRDQSPS